MSKRARGDDEAPDRVVAISAPQHRPNDTVSPQQPQVLLPVLPVVSGRDDLMLPHPQYLAKLFANAAEPNAVSRMLQMRES